MEREVLEAMVGKKVKSVDIETTWKSDEDIECVIIRYEDGTSVSISATTESGCQECDYDGSNTNYLMVN